MTPAQHIRALRLSLRLSQAAFGETVGVKHSAVSHWENGRVQVPYGRLLIICERWKKKPKDFGVCPQKKKGSKNESERISGKGEGVSRKKNRTP